MEWSVGLLVAVSRPGPKREEARKYEYRNDEGRDHCKHDQGSEVLELRIRMQEKRAERSG